MQYLIDASVYVFRAYYSMPDDMVDDEGNPVNALYGYCRFLGDFMERVNPEFVAVLFDESLTMSFRTEIYPQYKANREPAPLEINIFGIRWRERYRNQLHPGLFGRATTFVVVTAAARRRNVVPGFAPTV